MLSTLGISLQTVTTNQPFLNLNLIPLFTWIHPLDLSCISSGTRLVVQTQEWLRQQTAAGITDEPVPDWRELDIQGPIVFMLLFTSSGRAAFWWTWMSASLASKIHIGTLEIRVAVLTGRLGGLLILWRSVLSEVGNTWILCLRICYAYLHRQLEWRRGTCAREIKFICIVRIRTYIPVLSIYCTL